MNRYPIISVFLLLALFLLACDKNESTADGTLPQGKLKSLTVEQSKYVNTFSFSYNNWQLANVTHTHILDNIESTFTKTSRQYLWNHLGNNNYEVNLVTFNNEDKEINYFINSSNLLDSIVRDSYIPGIKEGGKLNQTYTYNNQLLREITEVLYSQGYSDSNKVTYNQGMNGNVIKKVVITSDSTTNIFVLEYDNHPNPFYLFVGIDQYFGFFGEIIYLNKNNITKVTLFKNGDLVGTTNFEYIYNKQGYPSHIVVKENGYNYSLEYY